MPCARLCGTLQARHHGRVSADARPASCTINAPGPPLRTVSITWPSSPTDNYPTCDLQLILATAPRPHCRYNSVHDMPAMAPDRGPEMAAVRYLPEGRHFTFRGVAVGLLVGLVICFSNMYFGLQTGWISMMTMPASLMGFGIFKALSRHLEFPFSPVENVLVQSVAGGMAVMPLGCGFVGVVSLGVLVVLAIWL